MRFLLFILRFIFGSVFIISGFFKLVDPVGTGLIVKEYLNLMHIGFLSFGAIPFGMIQSVLELIVGIAVFMRMRMKLFSLIGLILTSLFTVITFFLLIFNPLQDCGCFGEAIYLTPLQTFIKNIVLSVCIIPIFLYRKKFRRVAPVEAEWTFLGVYGVIAVSISLYSLIRMPVADFGNFKTGTNISVKLDEVSGDYLMETAFIYEKGGKTKKFKIDELPDSTWTFVNSIDISNNKKHRAPFDFSVSDMNGRYFTDALISTQIPTFFCVITDLQRFSSTKRWKELVTISEGIKSLGGDFIVLSTSTPEEIEEASSSAGSALSFGFADYKTLISLQRSNGGYVYLNDAIVIKKWSKGKLSPDAAAKVMSMDSEIVMSRDIIKRQLIYEISIVAIFFSIILMRYICGIIYGRRQKFFA